jgi:hypothetical protein
MANELRIKVTADAGDVQGTMDALGGTMQKFGKAALEASAGSKNAWKELGNQLTALDPSLAGVAAQIIYIANVSDKVGAAGAAGNVKQLDSALFAAGMSMADLRGKFEAIGAVSPEIAAKVQSFATAADAGFTLGAQKLNDMKDAAESVRAKMGEAGGAAVETSASMGKLGVVTTSTWQEFAKLGDQGKAAATAMAGLDKAADSPRALQTAAARATVEIQSLAARLKEAGQPIPPALEASLRKAEAAISAAGSKAALLRDTNADLKKSSDVAALGLEGLAGSLGSVDGILSQLKAQKAGGFAESVGMGGLALAALTVGLSLVIEKLKEADQWAKRQGLDLAQVGEKGWGVLIPFLSKAYQELDKAGISMSDLGKEVVSGDQANRKYGDYIPGLTDKINVAAASHDFWKQKLTELEQAAKQIGITWIDSAAKQGKLSSEVKLANDITQAATKTTGGLGEAMKNNAPFYAHLQEEIDKGNIKLSQFSPIA